jgi:hypothetical protein
LKKYSNGLTMQLKLVSVSVTAKMWKDRSEGLVGSCLPGSVQRMDEARMADALRMLNRAEQYIPQQCRPPLPVCGSV